MSRVLPILFNTEMVQAILDGRKTVTRRAVKSPYFVNEYGDCMRTAPKGSRVYREIGAMPYMEMPYRPGDILYVRETWQYLWELDGSEQIIEGTGKYYYAASDPMPSDAYVDSMGATHQRTPWRPSIHMPKAAARIWLKVTDVRVERLKDITEEQVKAEGISEEWAMDWWSPTFNDPDSGGYPMYKETFAELWDSTIKKSDPDLYRWKANPWVWVIEFKMCGKPQS